MKKLKNDVFKKFCENVHFVDSNYEVSLWFIPQSEKIGDNHLLAKKKLKKLSEFLNKNKDLPHKYNNIIDDQKEKNIIENAPEGNPKSHYLPRRPVIRWNN